MADPNDSEKLKIVYDKIAEQHRYFLSWRQYLLAGSIAVFGTLVYASFTLFEKGGIYMKWALMPIFVNGLLALFFRQLDKRNRMLYRICQEVGGEIERVILLDIDKNSDEYKGLISFDENNPPERSVALFFMLANKQRYQKKYQKKLDKMKKEQQEKWVLSHSELMDIFYCTAAVFFLVIAIGGLFAIGYL